MDAAALLGAAAALVLSVLFTGFAIKVWLDRSERSAKAMFGFSILYLFLLFAMLLVDRMAAGWPTTLGLPVGG